MVQRTRLQDAECPVARSLDAIGDWWSLLIVRDAFDGLTRFGEFQRNLGMAKNILAARLRTLVAHGIFQVVPASDGSAYQEYVLTEKGQGLFNLGSYSNPKIDELTLKVQSETDEARRNAMIAEAFKLHAEDFGHIPLHQQALAWAMKKNVEMVHRADNRVDMRMVKVN